MELFDVLILSVYEPAKKIRSGITSDEFDVLNKEWEHTRTARATLGLGTDGKMLCLVPHYEEGLDE
jgi:hypothetical protein